MSGVQELARESVSDPVSERLPRGFTGPRDMRVLTTRRVLWERQVPHNYIRT